MKASTQLAIVIPAYKSDFLEKALHSISIQTNKNFNVYIGDDNSHNDLESIVNLFRDKIDITYVKFETNLGSKSLTKQWERCIELSKEKWVWLFSDDDEMDPECIASFYSGKKENSEFYKFRTRIIDAEERELKVAHDITNEIREPFSAENFLRKRLNGNGFRSYAVEYIFSRKLYDKIKFVDFPLAWASDDASWASYAVENGGISLLDAYVSWRYSGKNITSIMNDDKIGQKKIAASLLYIQWLKRFIVENQISINDSNFFQWFTYQLAGATNSGNWEWYSGKIKEGNLNIGFLDKVNGYKFLKLHHYKKRIKTIIRIQNKGL